MLGPGVGLPGGGAQLTYGIGAGELRAEAVELPPLGSRFRVDGAEVELGVPGAPQRPERPGRAGRVPRGRPAEPAEAGAGAGRLHRRRPALRGARHGPRRRARLRRLRPPPDRGAGHARGRAHAGAGRVVAVFQPHLYSRTSHLAREFGAALALADVVVVSTSIPARERAEDYPGVSGRLVAAAAADAARGRPVWWLPGMDEAARMLRGELREGDVLLTLGAGDVDALARRLTA